MIIPANQKAKDDLKKTSLFIRQMLETCAYIADKYCQDDLIVMQIERNEVTMDLFFRSGTNGVRYLERVINEIYTYNPADLSEKVLFLRKEKSGIYLILRKGPRTTSLNKDDAALVYHLFEEGKNNGNTEKH